MQRQILNLEVRIITVVFIAGAAFAAVCGFSLLRPGRFLDGLWSVKAGSEHQFRTMGWSGPLFLLALAIALIAAGIGLSRRRGWARWATIALLMANLVADIPDFVHGDLAVLPFVVLITALIAGLCLPAGRGYFSRWGRARPTASGS